MRRLLALPLLLALSACKDITRAGPASLVIANQASIPIDGIFIRDCDATAHGSNRLKDPLPSLVSRRFSLDVGCSWIHAEVAGAPYDSIQVPASAGDERSWTVIDRPGVPVGAGAVWTPVTAPRGADGAAPTWRSIAHGNGTFVAVGSGLRAASADGEHWTVESGLPAAEAEHVRVAFGNGRFIATVAGGVVTSDDGRRWTYRPIAEVTFPSAVAYGNGTWVVADNRFNNRDYTGFLLSTDNGVTWESVANALPWGVTLHMSYANGRFVLVGGEGLAAYSTNGRVWSIAELARVASQDDGLLREAVYAQNKWTLVTGNGSVFWSPNGTFWNFLADWLIGGESGAPYNFNGVAYGNGFFAAVGLHGNIWTSQQGKSWGRRGWADATTGFEDVVFGDGRFVAVGTSFAVSK